MRRKKALAEAQNSERLVNAAELRGRTARALKLKGHQGLLRLESGRVAFEEPDGTRVFDHSLDEFEILKTKRSGFVFRVDDKKMFVAVRAKPRRKRPAFRPHDPVSDAIWVPYLIMSARDRRHNRKVVRTWQQALAAAPAQAQAQADLEQDETAAAAAAAAVAETLPEGEATTPPEAAPTELSGM
jgi:hypothetical protein